MPTANPTSGTVTRSGGSSTGGICLDIDETCSNTVEHWVRELRQHFGDPEPGMSNAQIVGKYRLAQNVPLWQTDEVRAWMQEKMHSPEYHLDIPVISGASEGARELVGLMDFEGYITMRPESVIDATREWLRAHEFPAGPILAKPDHIPSHLAVAWKIDTLVSCFPKVRAFVEDRTDVALALPADYRGTLYLLGHERSPRSDSVHIVPCNSWQRVVEAVREVELSHGRDIDLSA